MGLYREEDLINLPRMRQERVEKARAQMEKEGIGEVLSEGECSRMTE